MSEGRLAYDVVDVFTDRPFAGNPLAVVHGADHLSTQQMLALAREFNLSETAFPTPVDASSYRVRIFTPGEEVPFAGHPTVGTAWVLHRRGEVSGTQVVQHCGAGQVEVRVDGAGARLRAAARHLGDPLDADAAADVVAAVGLEPADVVAPVRVASCGLAFVYVRVVPDAIGRVRPGATFPLPAGGRDPVAGVSVHAVEPNGDALAVHARVLCPDLGVTEDPATGSAAAALGLVLVADGPAAGDGETAYVVSQGAEVGRPSTLHCAVTATGGAATTVAVGGGVRPVASGTVAVPD